MVEFAQWRARTGKFAEGQKKYAWDALQATPSVDGITFWTGFYDDSPLSLVYKALQFVQITTAPCERNWSIGNAIHTKVRKRLDVETASKLTFIKHNLLLKHANLFQKPKRRDELDEPESEENVDEHNVVEEIDEFKGTNFSQLFPGIKRFPVTLPMQFWFPIRREVLTMTGTISSDKEAIEYVLDRPGKGYAVAIVPGGAAEALDSHPDTYALTLKNRKGFVRLAIKHGANLVPLYHFGENKIYSQVPNPPGSRLRKFQEQLKKWTGATMPIFYGRGVVSNIIGLMPYRKEIVTVVGAPIKVKENANPSEEEVDEVHAEYCRQLSNLFNEHKTKYGLSEDIQLEYV